MSGWNCRPGTPTAASIFWSGSVADDGKGPVEPGAHFYRSYQLDGDGNPINKRNAWQARSVLYVRLIPPGAADVAHYPRDGSARCAGPDPLHGEAELPQVLLVLHAIRLRRRAQAGQDPALLTRDHNGLEYTFDPRRFPPTSPARSAAAFRICRS